eukprot:18173_1
MSTSILGTQIDPTFCQNVYYPPFIPHFGKESAFSLITVCLEFLILLFLLSCILRKKWYQCRGLENEARSLLLPFYDRVVYYYCFVTLFRIVFYLAQFMYEIMTPVNTRAVEHLQPFWVIIGDAIGEIGIIGLQVFILFLLMQTSAGTKAYKRAFRGTIMVCLIELVIILVKRFYGQMSSNYSLFCIGQILEESVLFCVFIGVTIYCYFYQMVKHRKRERNKILYVYIALLAVMDLVLMTAYLLLLLKMDGYCLDIIEQYLFRLFFPWIAFITIRSDSEFWRMLLLSWQTASSKAYAQGEKEDADDLLAKIKSIFGMENHNKRSLIDPLIDALSLGVKMVDFTELHEQSDPFAMGSTATVSTAKLGKEVVAVKTLIFSELSMEVVSEFFRESLLITHLHHENIVEFRGACVRPPDLVLVYEYCCCGDLTHLILTQFFHPQSLRQNRDDDEAAAAAPDPKLFVHRIKMLLDVSRGMTRLHDSAIIHRDLKTSNVLVHYHKRKGYIAKVCDFGSARKVVSNEAKKEYIAPPAAAGKRTQSLQLKQKKTKVKKHEIVIDKERAQTHGSFNLFVEKKKSEDRLRVFSHSQKEEPKTSINYYDIDEEEKYDKPQHHTDAGRARGESEAKTEAPTEYNYDPTAQTVSNNRDPTQLAFSVSPILLTTQVGTLAFMAPEILSHVNIGALSGGWQNKDKEKKKNDAAIEEESESEENLDIAPSSTAHDIAHLVIESKPPPPPPAPDLERHTTPKTIVIKVDSNANTKNNANFSSLPPIRTREEPLKRRTKPTGSIQSMNIAGASNGSRSPPPTNAQKRFTREYIAKHRELTSRREDAATTAAVATPPPKKALPPTPQLAAKRSRNISIMSRIGMFASSYTNNENSWQNRDIFAFQAGPTLAPAAEMRYHSPSSIKYSVPLSKPREQIEAKNVSSYAARALPPDPPKRLRKKHKASYFSRQRSHSKVSNFQRKKSIGSHLGVQDRTDAISIYETQQFDIVYEVSDNALYDDSVDVYSFAVIMWEVALCDRIYNQMDMKMIRDMVCQGERMPTPTYKECQRKKKEYALANVEEAVYNTLIKLINQCWAQSPVDRPKFYEIQKKLQLIYSLHQMKT